MVVAGPKAAGGTGNNGGGGGSAAQPWGPAWIPLLCSARSSATLVLLGIFYPPSVNWGGWEEDPLDPGAC